MVGLIICALIVLLSGVLKGNHFAGTVVGVLLLVLICFIIFCVDEEKEKQEKTIQQESARQARYEAKKKVVYSNYLNSALTTDIIEKISKSCPQYRPSEIRVSCLDVIGYYNGSPVAVYDFITNGVPMLERYWIFKVNGKDQYVSPDDDIRINYPMILAEAINARMGNIIEAVPVFTDLKNSHEDYGDETVTITEGNQEYVQL